MANKNEQIFNCDVCYYSTSVKHNYDRHTLTRKHQNAVKQAKLIKDDVSKKTCDCGKTYAHIPSLYRHKNICPILNIRMKKRKTGFIESKIDKQWILKVLEQNQELIMENKDFKDKLYELASKPSIVHNTTKNIHNKQFNIQVFLNETCKNAMNLSDFVQSLVIKNEEFEDMGKLGYVQGISNILIRGLKELDETERPMHCTDKKRETVYIKENNVWNKELSREKMKQLVLDVSFKNVRKIPAWKAEHPDCEDASSYKYMDYVQILNQVMTGIHPESESDINKIIRNVATEVYLIK